MAATNEYVTDGVGSSTHAQVAAVRTMLHSISQCLALPRKFTAKLLCALSFYRLSEKAGTNGNFNYFSYFYLQVKIRG
jgi:hypothetical protein